MSNHVLRIFSYLPNPRVWKALIAADYLGVSVEVLGDKPKNLGNWLWDFDARELGEEEKTEDSPHARVSRRGFSGALYKTDAFMRTQPYGTVPAAFSPDGAVGVFESTVFCAQLRDRHRMPKVFMAEMPWMRRASTVFLTRHLCSAAKRRFTCWASTVSRKNCMAEWLLRLSFT